MIVLDTTTKSVEVVLAAAKSTNDMAILGSWADTSTTTFTPGSSNASTNGTSVVTAIAAPGTAYQRIVKAFTLYNADTSSNTATIRLNTNGTLVNQIVVGIAVGDTLEYAEGYGWKIISSAGYLKNSAGLTNILGTANQVTATVTQGSATLSIPSAFTVPGGLQSTNPMYTPDGTAVAPANTFASEVSLGLYRSGASVLALSYGTFDTATGGLRFKNLAGSAFTAGSSATTRTLGDAAFMFSVLSLTSNGAEIGFRSGNTVWKWSSNKVN